MFRLTAICGGLLLSALASAATLEVIVRNPPDFKQLRVEYGNCKGDDIAEVVDQKIVDAPTNSVFFVNVTPGVLCLRAYWSNQFGESLPVKGITGPPPESGSIVTVTFGP